MAEEGEKGRFRQSWTVRVTNAKRKSSGAETQRCVHLCYSVSPAS